MSILFPKVNKPREWDYRPIYYDPDKEERKRKLEALHQSQAAEQTAKTEGDKEKPATASDSSNKEPYVPTLHRGSFREARNAQGGAAPDRLRRTSRLTFWIALLALLIFFFVICSKFTL